MPDRLVDTEPWPEILGELTRRCRAGTGFLAPRPEQISATAWPRIPQLASRAANPSAPR